VSTRTEDITREIDRLLNEVAPNRRKSRMFTDETIRKTIDKMQTTLASGRVVLNESEGTIKYVDKVLVEVAEGESAPHKKEGDKPDVLVK
jgi:hypothetical protein